MKMMKVLMKNSKFYKLGQENYHLIIESGDLVASSSTIQCKKGTRYQYFLTRSDHQSAKKWALKNKNCSNCFLFSTCSFAK